MGLDVPIVNAPMGGAAGGRLAAAVSRAGGLGMIGMGSSATAEVLRRELAALGALDRPFGIGLVHWVMTGQPELFETALGARPALLSVSFGEDWEWVRRAHDAGVRVTTQVATVDAARRAADAGVDVLVARGAEGGGHGVPVVGTLPLLTEVLDTVEVPVLAAGGIASARGVAAVLAAGAAGAWVGTAFATCVEALTPDAAREALLAAGSGATTLTSEFDIAAGYRWPASIPERVLVDATGRATPVNAGEGVGMVTQALTAAETITRLMSRA
jgi:nitronate monooxygenase